MLSDMSNFHLKKKQKYEIKANINKPRVNRYAKNNQARILQMKNSQNIHLWPSGILKL